MLGVKHCLRHLVLSEVRCRAGARAFWSSVQRTFLGPLPQVAFAVQVVELFKQVDSDGDGHVSWEELARQVHRALPLPLPHRFARPVKSYPLWVTCMPTARPRIFLTVGALDTPAASSSRQAPRRRRTRVMRWWTSNSLATPLTHLSLRVAALCKTCAELPWPLAGRR